MLPPSLPLHSGRGRWRWRCRLLLLLPGIGGALSPFSGPSSLRQRPSVLRELSKAFRARRGAWRGSGASLARRHRRDEDVLLRDVRRRPLERAPDGPAVHQNVTSRFVRKKKPNTTAAAQMPGSVERTTCFICFHRFLQKKNKQTRPKKKRKQHQHRKREKPDAAEATRDTQRRLKPSQTARCR